MYTHENHSAFIITYISVLVLVGLLCIIDPTLQEFITETLKSVSLGNERPY